MRSEATANKTLNLTPLMRGVGRFFQARDDYQNIASAQYAELKGFADDICEGKMSLPIIHALKSGSDNRLSQRRLLSILQQRKFNNGVSWKIGKLAQDEIKACGGLDHTKSVVSELLCKVEEELTKCELETGSKNWILRLMKRRLEI